MLELRLCEETRDGWSERKSHEVSVSSGVSFARIFAVCTLGNKALYVESVDQGAGGLGLTERLAGTFTAYQLLTMT